jgi:hypothetical protein
VNVAGTTQLGKSSLVSAFKYFSSTTSYLPAKEQMDQKGWGTTGALILTIVALACAASQGAFHYNIVRRNNQKG